MAEPVLQPEVLQPYASFALLVYDGPDVAMGCSAAMAQLRRMATRNGGGASARVLASGLPDGWLQQQLEAAGIAADPDGQRFVAVDALAFRVTRPASWAKAGSDFTIVADELSVVFQLGSLVAVHCPPNQVDSLQRWLDGDPRPAFRRVRGDYLQQAFLRGEARGLWLKGTHRRQTAKADSKNLSGLSLGDALNPLDDGSFALTSGRANADGPTFDLVQGTVGTTPRKAWVWNGRAASFGEFVGVAHELLGIVLDLFANPPDDLPFPELAVELDSLGGVSGAFDAYVAEPDELRQLPDVADDVVAASEILQDALIDIEGAHGSANFTATVGRDGNEAGRLRVQPRVDRGRVQIDVGLAGSPSDPATTAAIREALQCSSDLLSVYYESGHQIGRGSITKVNQSHHPFKGWEFVDFLGFDRRLEKPAEATPQAIHSAIGSPGDLSLFSWIAQHLNQGLLTCDDGGNEVADFVHIADDGTLSLLHVKAASAAATHRVSTGAFELVINQAVKNLRYAASSERLMAALEVPHVAFPACWVDGTRVADRSKFLDALRMRTASDDLRVVIVQPHHTKAIHDTVRIPAGGPSLNRTRFELIETMLTSARASAVGVGGDLVVWGAL